MVRPEQVHLKSGDAQPPLQKGLLRLYTNRFCPFAQRVRLVLDTKKISYDLVNIHLYDKPGWLLEKSSAGKVPIIELESGDIIHESLIVAEFLDEAYQLRPLYSRDLLTKARDKLFLEQFSQNFVPKLVKMLFNLDTVTNENVEDFLGTLDQMEKELSKRNTTFFSGSKTGMVDLMMWPFFERSHMLTALRPTVFQVPEERFPKIKQWEKDMLANEAVQETHLPTEILLQNWTARDGYNTDYDILVKK